MQLSELLDSVGINKTVLAKLLDVSRQTVHRMGEEVSPEVLAIIDRYKLSMTPEQSEFVPVAQVKAIEHEQLTETIPVTHRNIALSRIDYGAGIPIDVVAHSFGLSVFDYNQAVSDTVAHCTQTATSFIQLRQ